MEKKQITQPKWHSVYIYYKDDPKYCLVEVIKPLIDELTEQELIQKFFFVKYWEDGPHLRLRTLSLYNLAEKINGYLKEKADKNQFLTKFKEVEYVPELSRYGGVDAIGLAELQFYHSSKKILKLCASNLKAWDYSLAIGYAIELHTNFAKGVGLSLDESILFFKTAFYHWLSMAVNQLKIKSSELVTAFDKSFERQEQQLTASVALNWEGENHLSWQVHNRQVSQMLNILQSSDKIFYQPEKKPIFSSDRNKQLWPIFDSFCHMTNNRLGILNRDESYIYYVILRALNKLKEKLK